jgi:hypothetical protein
LKGIRFEPKEQDKTPSGAPSAAKTARLPEKMPAIEPAEQRKKRFGDRIFSL